MYGKLKWLCLAAVVAYVVMPDLCPGPIDDIIVAVFGVGKTIMAHKRSA